MDATEQRARPETSGQTCEQCKSARVTRTILTPLVVYFRCQDCGCVWNIPERRNVRRTGDPERVDF